VSDGEYHGDTVTSPEDIVNLNDDQSLQSQPTNSLEKVDPLSVRMSVRLLFWMMRETDGYTRELTSEQLAERKALFGA
jgi:hypothetical protein